MEGDDSDGWLGREGGLRGEGHDPGLLRTGDQMKERGSLDWREWEGCIEGLLPGPHCVTASVIGVPGNQKKHIHCHHCP